MHFIYLFLTAEKNVQAARNGGRGGGEVIRAMPERKHSFLKEVFPKGLFTYYVSQKQEFVDPPSPLGQQWSSFG